MDSDAYLHRIRYHGPLGPSAETLQQLQVAHLVTVPFENLSIHAREPIVLDDQALFEKIVVRRRGGFCYELNGLFAWLLRTLGFDVTMISADVVNARGEYGPPFDHMALIVTLAEPWLVDVGFGESFREPLRMQPGLEQVQGDRAYRIDCNGGRLDVMHREGARPWRSQYRFTLTPYQYADYAEMCAYHQTASDSHFTQQRICSMATAEGRITLTGNRLIVTTSGQRLERELASDAEYRGVLREQFGMRDLPDIAGAG